MRVLVCDDHPLFRLGVRHVLGAMLPMASVVEVGTLHDARIVVSQEQFDAAIIDLILPDGKGVDVVDALRVKSPSATIAIVTAMPIDQAKAQCVSRHLVHVHPKEAPVSEIVSVFVETATAEGEWLSIDPHDALTRRELEVLAGLRAGLANKDIGVVLGISAETVKDHVRSLCSKLAVSNRTEAAVLAARWGLEPLSRPM